MDVSMQFISLSPEEVSLITKHLLTNRRYAEELRTAIHCYARKYLYVYSLPQAVEQEVS
jgi:hypothetical protein